MRSIPAALTWELLHRGFWPIAGAFLGALAFPLLICFALQHDGALDATSPALITMQVITTQVGLMGLGAGIFTALGLPARMFTLPISSAGIALCQLVPAGILAAGLWTACVAILNRLLPLEWPILGPALFAAVSVPAVLAVSWYTDKTIWLPIGMGVVAAALFLWLKSHFGGVFATSDHQWRDVTAGDGLFLGFAGTAAYFIGVAGIARRRRHEPLPSPRFTEWLERILEGSPAENLRFASGSRAQLWAEWRSKGILLPGLVVIVGVVGLTGWLIFSREPVKLYEGVQGLGGMLIVIAGLLGLVIGNLGPPNSTSVMGPFIATRPLTSESLARVVLQSQLRAVASATIFWQLAYWATSAFVEHNTARVDFPPAWFATANWILPWAAASIGTLLCLTGRSGGIGIGIVILCTLTLVAAMVLRWCRGGEAAQSFLVGSAIAVSIAVIAGTVVGYFFALRRHMVSVRTTSAAGGAFLIGLVALAFVRIEIGESTTIPWIVGTAILATCIAPLAMAPLAIAWNRHR